MKIVTVAGASPQFIKASVVSHMIRKCAIEILVHVLMQNRPQIC